MNMDILAYKSKLRNVNSMIKFIYTIFNLILLLSTRSISIAIFLFIINGVLTIYFGGIPFFVYYKYFKAPVIFLIISIIGIIFNFSKIPKGLFNLNLGFTFLIIKEKDLYYGLNLFIIALCCVSILYFLSFSTPMPNIISCLRRFHIPELFNTLMILIYRYIFLLLEESSSIRTAQNARLGYGSFKNSLKDFSKLVTAVFVSSLSKSNKIFDSMQARAFDGKFQVIEITNPLKKKHIFFFIVLEVVLIGIYIIERIVI